MSLRKDKIDKSKNVVHKSNISVGNDLHIGDIIIYKNFNFKLVFVYIAITATILMICISVINAFTKFNKNSFESKEKIELIKRELNVLSNSTIDFGEKEKSIKTILSSLSVYTKVIYKGVNGRIIDEIELEHFLTELSLGAYDKFEVESFSEDKLVIKCK